MRSLERPHETLAGQLHTPAAWREGIVVRFQRGLQTAVSLLQ